MRVIAHCITQGTPIQSRTYHIPKEYTDVLVGDGEKEREKWVWGALGE